MSSPLFALVFFFACTRNEKDGDSAGTVPVDDSGTPPTDDSGTVVTDDSGKTDDTGTEHCYAEIDTVFPEEDTTDAFYRSAIEATLDLPDSTSTLDLQDATGTAVAGKVSHSSSNDVVIFTPSEPLLPNATYDASVTWCAGSYAWSFTTDVYGEPVANPSSLEGRTYTLSLSDGRWVEPAGAAGYIEGALENNILMMVLDVDLDAQLISQRLTLAETGAPESQDTCLPTQDVAPADFSDDPFFSLGPTDTTMTAGGYKITIHDLVLSGAFAPDGSSVGGALFQGFVDMRELGPALAGGLSGEKICALAGTFGFSCVACSDGEELCVGLVVDSLEAAEIPSPLEPIAEYNCHEDCAASGSNPDCKL